jgi:glycolate oxidase subunit GlcD
VDVDEASHLARMVGDGPPGLVRDLGAIVGREQVLAPAPASYLADEGRQAHRALQGHAEAVVRPGTADEVARVVAWCYANDVPVVPRGGGTGLSGGAVPFGGVVLALERLTAVREFDPLRWRIAVEAGMTTFGLKRLVRESGLVFPPDPGAGEQSQIGGNVSTNAGGPHAFRFGTTGAWVTGLEVVLPPGELVRIGGPVRKDVAGYDLRSLLVGSEGTLGVVTTAWLKLLPAPEAVRVVVGVYPDVASGCDALEAVIGSGLLPAALEYFDGGTLRHVARGFPTPLPDEAGFMVIAEVDGSEQEAARQAVELADVLAEGSVAVFAPEPGRDVDALWRWREGVGLVVTQVHGGRISDDHVVPLERLRDAIAAMEQIGARYGLEAASFGHAGDGNLHAGFLYAPGGLDQVERAEAAALELYPPTLALDGSVAGEHGVGVHKLVQAQEQLGPRRQALQHAIKQVFDPKGLLNPGKKVGPAPGP